MKKRRIFRLLVSFCVLRKKGLDCHKVHKWWLSFLVDLSLYLSPGIKLPLQRSTACANVQYLQAMVHGMISKPPQALNKWKEEQQTSNQIKQTDLWYNTVRDHSLWYDSLFSSMLMVMYRSITHPIRCSIVEGNETTFILSVHLCPVLQQIFSHLQIITAS